MCKHYCHDGILTNFPHDPQPLLVVWSSSAHKDGHTVLQQLVLVLLQRTHDALQAKQHTHVHVHAQLCHNPDSHPAGLV